MEEQPSHKRLGLGFSYEEIREKCREVVGDVDDKPRVDLDPESLGLVVKDPDSAGHIVNVDEPKHVTFSQRQASNIIENENKIFFMNYEGSSCQRKKKVYQQQEEDEEEKFQWSIQR